MLVNKKYIYEFLLGGKCECAIENINTGNRFEYRISKADSRCDNRETYFIKVKRVTWMYAGHLNVSGGNCEYVKGDKGMLDSDSIEIKALIFVLRNYLKLPDGIFVNHFGRCSRCYRRLSDAESIRRGLGPECYKKLKGVL